MNNTLKLDQKTTPQYYKEHLNELNNLTCEEVFQAFANDNYSFWLDSGNSGHVNSRFDILVFSPFATVKTAITSSRIHFLESDTVEISNDDPLAIVDRLVNEHFTNDINEDEDIPFCGGALGFFSYDLGRRFETLPSTARVDIALPEMAIGIYKHAIIFDRENHQYTLVSQQDNLQELRCLILDKLSVYNAKDAIKFRLQCDWQANMTEQQYQEKFATVQQYLLSGDCYQINLAQRFSALYEGDEFQAYKHLRKANNAPFSAFMRIDEGCILSVSPERFLQLKNQKVQTKPIKGTRPRSSIPEFDAEHARELQSAEKDRAENLMIVDLLRNDISKACRPGTVTVPSLFAIESFPAVHHLVSTVEGMLASSSHATDLLRGAFPGGSITGAPKIRAMEIIEELEPHRRSVYCGSVGYISACGKMDTSITIRTLICENEKIHCWAGGGLVADSKAASEYQETFDKVNKILPILSKLNLN